MGITFFVLASDINFKYILVIFKKIFKTNNDSNNQSEIKNELPERLIDIDLIAENSQQSFPFEKKSDVAEVSVKHESFKNFKLPSVELLERNPSKINLSDQSKNMPDGSFIEKILLDFGIEGKIKKINNGPVVSLYEFEPAPGVKVSKIINLSDDIARNTSSTSARVSIIPGKNTIIFDL